MRLFPVVPLHAREACDDLVLNNMKIPKGTTLFFPAFVLHRSEEIWGQNANKFQPERFSILNEAQHDAFLPFASEYINVVVKYMKDLILQRALEYARQDILP